MANKRASVPLSSLKSLHSWYSESLLTLPQSSNYQAQPNREFNSRIRLWQGDMTRLEVTAVVNAANQSLLGGGGIDGAIHRAAGPRLLIFNRTLRGCRTGEAKIAPGFSMPSSFVIHTVGPIYDTYESEEEAEKLLESCYESCLKKAVEKDEHAGKNEEGVESLAFCGISTGVYGYPLNKATKIALRIVRKFLDTDPKQHLIQNIIFVCFPDRDFEVYKQILPFYFPPTEEEVNSVKTGGEGEAESVRKQGNEGSRSIKGEHGEQGDREVEKKDDSL